MTRPSVSLAQVLWGLSLVPEAARFHRALREVRRVQERLLLEILRANRGTEYGRRYGFERIRCSDEYRERVPLVDYEDIRSDVQRIAAGQSQVLTRGAVRILQPTGGSTGGRKLIPSTDASRCEFARAVAPWIVDLFVHEPGLLTGRAYWSASPVAQEKAFTPSGIAIGFDDDTEYLGSLARRLLGLALAVPMATRLIDHIPTFRYVTLFHLLAASDLTLVSVWSPSFLRLILDGLSSHGERLAADVARGSACPPLPLPPNLRDRGVGETLPDRPRAARIREALVGAPSPGELHRRLWPRLRIVSCWGAAAATRPAHELGALLPQARLQAKGLIATEGFVTLPVLGREGGALAVRSHFFEFLPEEGGGSRLAHEVEPGRVYSVVLTTGGGLYRYRLGDMVRVTGRMHQAPTMEFLGRERAVCDHVGEKLHELHVTAVLDASFRAAGIDPAFSLVGWEEDGEASGYALFVEDPRTGDAALRALGWAVDLALGQNVHYAYARRLGQLPALRVFRVESGGQEAYLRRSAHSSRRLGDVKPISLSSLTGWASVLGARAL